MANNIALKFYFTIIPFIILAISQASTIITPSTPVSSDTICKSTPDPSFCKSVLPSNQPSNVFDYARFSIRRSITQSRIFLALINKYLSLRSMLSTPAIRALEDCQGLATANIDFLLSSFQTVNTTSQILSTLKADDIVTLLSAILTNQQTCYDGVALVSSSWSMKNGIFQPLANDTKLNSVSLALFTIGWVPKTKKKSTRTRAKRQFAFQNGRMPMKMSSQTRAIYETVMNRKLLQTSDDDGDVTVSDIVTVKKDGSGNFTSINDAIAFAPNKSAASAGYFFIYITAGVYEEYVLIPKNKRYLMIVGDGINKTILTGNRNVVDGWTTFNSATLAVSAPGFVAVNMTIRNTAGAIKHQAVAVRNGADLSTFYRCSFEAYQDTLYTHSQRQFYRECDIYGTVDFIFGNAAVVLQNCNIYPRLPMSGQFNAITAQGRTDPNQNTGISIQNCTIKPDADLLSSAGGSTQTYLGRPWKEYSRTVYLQNYMDGFINPAGWRAWDGTFALSTLYYGEYGNTGPGSSTSGRVTWEGYHTINSTDAGNFTVSSFLLGDDWLPQTGVTYSEGL